MSYKSKLNLDAIATEVRVAFKRPYDEPIDITQTEYRPCFGRYVRINLPKDVDIIGYRELNWLAKRLFIKELFRNISFYYSSVGEGHFVLSFVASGGIREKYYEKES